MALTKSRTVSETGETSALNSYQRRIQLPNVIVTYRSHVFKGACKADLEMNNFIPRSLFCHALRNMFFINQKKNWFGEGD